MYFQLNQLKTAAVPRITDSIRFVHIHTHIKRHLLGGLLDEIVLFTGGRKTLASSSAMHASNGEERVSVSKARSGPSIS